MEIKLNAIQQQSGVAPQAGGQQAPVTGGCKKTNQVFRKSRILAFQPHEKNEVIQSLRDLTASLRDMKNYVS